MARYAKWYYPKGVYDAADAGWLLRAIVWLKDFRSNYRRNASLKRAIKMANWYRGKNRILL